MNIPPLLDISTDPSSLFKPMTRPAPCHYRDPITQTRSLASRLRPSLLWRTDCPVACKADNSASSVHSLIIFLGFITLSVWLRAQTEHRAPLLLCVLGLVCLSRRFGQAWSSLARSLCTLRKSCRTALRRKSETCARLAVSAVGNRFEITFTFWPCIDSRQTRKHTWRHAERNEEWVLCFGGRG